MESSDNWFPGSGAGAGKVAHFIDLSPSQHVGNWVNSLGSTSADLPIVIDDYTRMANGVANRIKTSGGDPTPNVMVKIFVFRFLAITNTDSCYIFSNRQTFIERPHFRWGTAGTWFYNSGGGGGTDATSSGEGSNKAAIADAQDGNWHCFAIHHSPNAAEGLLVDLDGEALCVPASFTQNDLNDFAGNWQVMAHINPNATTQSFATLDIRAVAHGKNATTVTHAQTRELASALMAQYGIEDLG
jgi:hypothetical protein